MWIVLNDDNKDSDAVKTAIVTYRSTNLHRQMVLTTLSQFLTHSQKRVVWRRICLDFPCSDQTNFFNEHFGETCLISMLKASGHDFVDVLSAYIGAIVDYISGFFQTAETI